jgi:gliding motility-associated-like protein
LQFTINGNSLGPVITTPPATCQWEKYSTTWNSGDSSTATISIVNKNAANGFYFALDDITFSPLIMQIDSVFITIDTPMVKTIPDTATCRGVQIKLTTTGANTYRWQPPLGLSDSTSSSPIASPADSTKYFVTGTSINNCKATDSVIVSIKPTPRIFTSPDTSICKNSTIPLRVSGGNSYRWLADTTLSSDTIPNPFASPRINTTYYVFGTDPAFTCVATDSIRVSIKNTGRFSISPNDSVCSMSSVQLNTTGGNVFKWQPSSLLNNPAIANPIATPIINTTFTVLIKDSTCNDSALLSTSIKAIPLPRTRAGKTNDIDCYDLNATIFASGADTYLWEAETRPLYLTDSSLSSTKAFPAFTKKYFVTGTDTLTTCKNIDSVVVFVYIANNPLFWAPNIFTPNADRHNDCFFVTPIGRLKYFELAIYNRWGNRVFQTKNINDCWDGTYKGQPQDPGNFVYYIKASTECKEDVTKGNLLLIR